MATKKLPDQPGITAQTQFFHLFKTMYDSGAVAEMGAYAFNVYCYIKSCVNYEKAEAFPSVETIALKTGISRAKVLRVIPELVKMGYLVKNTRGRHTVYKVKEVIPVHDSEGNVAHVASWEYIPKHAVRAVSELKELLMGKDSNTANYIHIEHLQVIIGETQNIVAGDNIVNGAPTPENQTLEYHIQQLEASGDTKTAEILRRQLKLGGKR